MINDMYSLLEWVKEEELIAHNAADSCVTWQMEQVHLARKKAFTDMKGMIEKNPNQRPHVRGERNI